MSEQNIKPYRVLARKYRPTTFSELIGQDVFVRTLSNSISSERLPHAWIINGVRGVGKTSAARIIARALNCVGQDGKGLATADPCGECKNCEAISNDCHVDVIEMDAASRTGVADIREIIESVRYRPTSARYKIYIVDEVHMLSNAAFNALLKTLEEPPPHVKFVFATTEIRKLPVTVLSRCQRFDLRRIAFDKLTHYFQSIAEKEGVSIDSEALKLIATFADGSVRDGLSLLDQAISNNTEKVTQDSVVKMLGLANRSQIILLFENLMQGDVAASLDILQKHYEVGVEPRVVLQDLLEVTHWITRLKVSPGIANEPNTPELEKNKGLDLSKNLSLPVLARTWQMLLKGLNDTRIAPNSLQAAEMVLIRLTYAAELPPPAELVTKLKDNHTKLNEASNIGKIKAPNNTDSVSAKVIKTPEPIHTSNAISQQNSKLMLKENTEHELLVNPLNFSEVAKLAVEKMEPRLNYWLLHDVHLVRFKPGHIELRIRDGATENMVNSLGEALQSWTANRWIIAISDEDGEATLADQRAAEMDAQRLIVSENLVVKTVIDAFPNATITNIQNHVRDSANDEDIES